MAHVGFMVTIQPKVNVKHCLSSQIQSLYYVEVSGDRILLSQFPSKRNIFTEISIITHPLISEKMLGKLVFPIL